MSREGSWTTQNTDFGARTFAVARGRVPRHAPAIPSRNFLTHGFKRGGRTACMSYVKRCQFSEDDGPVWGAGYVDRSWTGVCGGWR